MSVLDAAMEGFEVDGDQGRMGGGGGRAASMGPHLLELLNY